MINKLINALKGKVMPVPVREINPHIRVRTVLPDRIYTEAEVFTNVKQQLFDICRYGQVK